MTINDCLHDNSPQKNLKLNKYYAEKLSKETGIEIQSQHWSGNKKIISGRYCC